MPETVPVAKFFSPGAMFAESSTVELSDRSADAALARAPAHAFAFQLYDKPVIDFDYNADLFTVCPKLLNPSGKHFLGGQVFTGEQLRERAIAEGDPDKYRILIANITDHVDGRAVEGLAILCRQGNWQRFEDGDVVVDVGGES